MATPSSSVMSAAVLEQSVLGSRRLSNVLVAAAVSIGGLGFLLASLSSYLGRDLLPLGHPAALIFALIASCLSFDFASLVSLNFHSLKVA